MHYKIRNKVWNEVGNQVNEQVCDHFYIQTKNVLSNYVWAQLHNREWEQLLNQVKNQIKLGLNLYE